MPLPKSFTYCTKVFQLVDFLTLSRNKLPNLDIRVNCRFPAYFTVQRVQRSFCKSKKLVIPLSQRKVCIETMIFPFPLVMAYKVSKRFYVRKLNWYYESSRCLLHTISCTFSFCVFLPTSLPYTGLTKHLEI